MAATEPRGASSEEVSSEGASSEEERPEAAELGDIALFSSLDGETLSFLAKRLVVRTIAKDETLFEEGDDGRAMYVVLAGAATMFKQCNQRSSRMMTAHPGDWFGEMSLLDVMARPVTARAVAGTKLLVICPTDLSAVYRLNLKMYSLLVMNMARQLSRKLRLTELSLAQALCGDTQGLDVD